MFLKVTLIVNKKRGDRFLNRIEDLKDINYYELTHTRYLDILERHLSLTL